MSDTRVLLITPVYNEARQLDRVIRSVAAQTAPPARWLIVDDGSTDGTFEIASELARDVPFLSVLRAPPHAHEGDGDRLEAAFEAKAFNWALDQLPLDDFTHLGKLDGDIELVPTYLEAVLAEFDADARLGIAGGTIEEPTGPHGEWQRVRVPSYHVHGALKLYSRACFEAIGGMVDRLGWDTIDETRARMQGFRTRALPILVRHHRPAGSAQGVLRGRARAGHCAYILRYQLWWVVLRSVEVGRRKPILLSGFAFLFGYVRAWLRRGWRVEDEAFTRFTRAELRARLRRALRLQAARC